MNGIQQMKIKLYGQEVLKYIPTYVYKRKKYIKISYRPTLLRNQVCKGVLTHRNQVFDPWHQMQQGYPVSKPGTTPTEYPN